MKTLFNSVISVQNFQYKNTKPIIRGCKFWDSRITIFLLPSAQTFDFCHFQKKNFEQFFKNNKKRSSNLCHCEAKLSNSRPFDILIFVTRPVNKAELELRRSFQSKCSRSWFDMLKFLVLRSLISLKTNNRFRISRKLPNFYRGEENNFSVSDITLLNNSRKYSASTENCIGQNIVSCSSLWLFDGSGIDSGHILSFHVHKSFAFTKAISFFLVFVFLAVFSANVVLLVQFFFKFVKMAFCLYRFSFRFSYIRFSLFIYVLTMTGRNQLRQLKNSPDINQKSKSVRIAPHQHPLIWNCGPWYPNLTSAFLKRVFRTLY